MSHDPADARVWWRAVAIAWILIASVAPGAPASDESAASAGPMDVADWIVAQQWRGEDAGDAEGAVRIHHSFGHRFPPAVPGVGLEYYQVVPYNANLGVAGLLHSEHPERLRVAEDWMAWYLDHLYDPIVAFDPPPAATSIIELPPPPGAILDHWYLADGSGETTCPPGIDPRYCNHRDADDSNAATLLGLAWTFVQKGGDPDVLRQPGWRQGLEKVAGVMLHLQDADGLTWARSDYLAKFTMDNSEVQWGLDAMASLLEHVYGDPGAAAPYTAATEAVRSALPQLIDPDTGLYGWAKEYNGEINPADLDDWYPGTVAAAWPHLFGAEPADGPRAAAQMTAVNTWDGTGKPDWVTDTANIDEGFLWPSIGLAARLAGDDARADAHAAYVRCQRFAPDMTPGERFAWPWTVDDAGWWLRTTEGMEEASLGSCA